MTLKMMRKAAGYTQQSVAELVPETTQSAVSQWESGECYPHPTKIPALAKLYGVTADELLTAITYTKRQKQNSA